MPGRRITLPQPQAPGDDGPGTISVPICSAVVQCRCAVPAQSNFRCPAGRTHGAIPMGSEPGELYELHLERDEIELLNEPVLLVALDGYIDAGSGVRLAVEHLLATQPHTVIATFDIDQLIDYRARRPI